MIYDRRYLPGTKGAIASAASKQQDLWLGHALLGEWAHSGVAPD